MDCKDRERDLVSLLSPSIADTVAAVKETSRSPAMPVVADMSSVRCLFVLKLQAVQTAMDRKDRERELASALLSSLYPDTISDDQMAKGFRRLLQFTEVGLHAYTNCLIVQHML